MGGNGRVKGSRFFNLKISWFSKSSNPKGFKQNERELTKPENWQAGPIVWSNDDRSKKFAILAKKISKKVSAADFNKAQRRLEAAKAFQLQVRV